MTCTITYTCSQCGGERLKWDAWSEWDYENQMFTLAGDPLDYVVCEDCDGETKAIEKREEAHV